jgi:hypothetical protein
VDDEHGHHKTHAHHAHHAHHADGASKATAAGKVSKVRGASLEHEKKEQGSGGLWGWLNYLVS